RPASSPPRRSSDLGCRAPEDEHPVICSPVEAVQAADGAFRSVGRCGAMTPPSGSSSPVSSKSTTPLHSRLHPCSGCETSVRAASRSGASCEGQGGWCGHIVCLRSRLSVFCSSLLTHPSVKGFALTGHSPLGGLSLGTGVPVGRDPPHPEVPGTSVPARA